MANDIFGSFLAGQQAGQEQRRKRTLSDFLQPALTGDQGALSKVYAADPDAGLQVQGMVQKQQVAGQEQRMQQLELAAKAWRAAPPEMRAQLYPSIAELTESVLPQFAGKIPREYSPAYEANIDKFLSGFAPVEDNTPSSIRELQMLQQNPELAELDMRRRTAGFDRPQLIQTDSGYAWATPQGATPLNYGGQAPQVPADLDQAQVQNALAMLAGGRGVQMTSGLRTPERNAAVGGVPNSQHLRGTAGDYVVPQAQKAAFMQQAQAAGLHAIDEGDHVHVQARNGAGRVMPAQKQGASFSQLSPQEASQLGLPPGTVAQRNDETGQVSVVSKPDARAGTGVTPLSAGEAAKVRRDFKETKDALNTFKAFDQALKDIPNGVGLLVDGKAQGRLGTSYNNARAALRILYNTGVLQPGELPMLESALRDPNSFTAIMDPRTRPQIDAQLDELYRTVTRGIENQVASYPQIFNQQRFDDFREQKATPQSGPKPGEVVDGYRFKGGNPGQQSSWEKV